MAGSTGQDGAWSGMASLGPLLGSTQYDMISVGVWCTSRINCIWRSDEFVCSPLRGASWADMSRGTIDVRQSPSPSPSLSLRRRSVIFRWRVSWRTPGSSQLQALHQARTPPNTTQLNSVRVQPPVQHCAVHKHCRHIADRIRRRSRSRSTCTLSRLLGPHTSWRTHNHRVTAAAFASQYPC
jgi:hypothetical protein